MVRGLGPEQDATATELARDDLATTIHLKWHNVIPSGTVYWVITGLCLRSNVGAGKLRLSIVYCVRSASGFSPGRQGQVVLK
jgi:hypothetical protein